jgi:cysteinyl-tRNA synthetase
VDFSNEALQATERGLSRLMQASETLEKLKASDKSTENVQELKSAMYEAMNDDFNTPILIAHLFEAVRIINSVKDNKAYLTETDLNELKSVFNTFVFDILGMKKESDESGSNQITEGLMELILDIRAKAKENKDWTTSDSIRNKLNQLNINVKDTKDGAEWSIEN